MAGVPMVDCRDLIEFCKAFEQHRHMANSMAVSENSRKNNKQGSSLNPLSHPLCNQSPYAAVDIVILIFVLAAFAVLVIPYFKFICHEAAEVFPLALKLMGEVICHAPVAYAVGAVLVFATVLAAWEFIQHQSRKCGNPLCKGLRKSVEFDIQLESEECVKYLPPIPKDIIGVKPLELGQDHKELEAELKRMAPLNGRAVLIFRLPCGCPAGRMEVWGPKKLRRIKR